LGYAELIAHLEGRLSLAEAVELLKINTRQFAKAQRTWFRRFRETEWIDVTPDDTVTKVADNLMARRGSLWSA
jgi:tRNA dimethylallyltransferase